MTEIAEDEALAARDWLRRHQFQQVTAQGGPDAPFGDSQEIWERDGTSVRLTRDRGQWWADITRQSIGTWLDAYEVGGAIGEKSQLFTDHLAMATTVDDRVFNALVGYIRPSPA